MARVALGLGVRELAKACDMSQNTISRFERGDPLKDSTVQHIQTTLEEAGAIFIPRGVQIREPGPIKNGPVTIYFATHGGGDHCYQWAVDWRQWRETGMLPINLKGAVAYEPAPEEYTRAPQLPELVEDLREKGVTFLPRPDDLQHRFRSLGRDRA
jgi:transcriptional regulator with XRE-family HTH domain